jgi:glycosyltransferase involved in cell wall biosynthesis
VAAEPLFSVVVPTRDRPGPLAEAVASVLGQSVADLELIVVDDGGGVRPDLPDDPRVRLVRRAEAGGPAAAVNAGAAAARGRYLAFLDDDDWWRPDRLELALAGLARAPVAICWSRFLDEPAGATARRGRRARPRLDGDVADVVLDAITPHRGATALERSCFVPFDESFLGAEDVEWWWRTSRLAPVATVPEFGVVLRRADGPRGLHGDAARIDGSLRLLSEHADWFARHRRAAALRWYRVGLLARRSGDRALARRALVCSLWARPSAGAAAHLLRTLTDR